MTFTERLRTASALQEDVDVDLSLLLLQAAERIENQTMWKLKWAEIDHAYAELQERYRELQERYRELQKEFDNYRQEKSW